MMGDFNESTHLSKAFSYDRFQSVEDGGAEEKPIKKLCFQMIPKRIVVSFMMFLGCANMGVLRSVLSVAIVGMTTNHTVRNVNGTEVLEGGFQWNSRLQGVVLSSFFYGYVLTQIPGGWLANRYGGKIVFGIGTAVTGLLTLILPVCAKENVYYIIALRTCQGLALGVCFPGIYGIMRNWVPPLERSKLMTTSIAGKEIGVLICLGLSGVLTEILEWPSVFYCFGTLALIWCIGWLFVVYETPESHPTITQEELEYLNKNVGCMTSSKHNVPYRKIFTSLPVLAIIILDMCTYWSYYLMLAELPTYISQVHHYQIEKTGWISALPYAFLFFSGVISAQIADLLISSNKISRTRARKLFSTLCCIGLNSFLLGVAFSNNGVVAVLCLNISFTFLGLSYPTFPVNALDIAPQYSSIIMGVSNCATVMSGIISPIVTGHIVVEGTALEWRTVFCMTVVIHVFGSAFYLFFASGERQPWTEEYQQHFDEIDVTENPEQFTLNKDDVTGEKYQKFDE
ncbi:vesicular glutamate transporter 2-like [Lineus longissimus]|uniref:vesicular glutamate transporter 2-like n=1 Tax=Lineus longissimus TaxID=88925 RepID=UPI002B4F7D75